MEECVITIKFALSSSEVPGHYKAESVLPIYRECDDELSVIGQQFVCFLRQVGYANMENRNLLMESLTDEEYDAVNTFLNKYRNK